MFARPIKAVTNAARQLASGQLDVVLPVKTQDEIGDLTVALNNLSVELRNTENLRKELIANVSHELRAPLAVIQGYAELVRDVTWPSDEKRNQQLTFISEEATRLSRVVKDILDYSKLQAGVEHLKLTDLAICPSLDNIRQRLEIQAAHKNIQIRLDCPDLVIRFDPDKFEQVMNNLLNNAISHAAPDTTITIAAKPGKSGSRISVTNIGETIAEAEQSQIWDRYYRAEKVGESQRMGTGLGLAIVKSIFEYHHVAYGVVSENRETTFWFDTLPKD
jgi:signal transduction histidine kinase